MRYNHDRFNNNVERIIPGTGPYGIPEITAEKWEPCKFIGFNYVNRCLEPKNTGVHFFLDDYQFDRVWRRVEHYVWLLSRFKCVMSPDYSMYTDWPVALQIFSHYKKHYIGARLQEVGVTVYPTISWSDKRSYAWCFDGEPTHGTVCVSSVGTQRGKKTQTMFMDGYNAMMDRLEPETILFYGKVPKEAYGNIVNIESFSRQLKRKLDET